MSINIILFGNGPYYPGQTIEGQVACVFVAHDNIRGISLHLKGREETAWEEQVSYTDDTTHETKYRTEQFTGDNVFLEYQENLVGQGTQNPGRYEYPFRFILPKNAPGTYNGPHGHIRYTLKAKVDIPMARDYEDEKPFIVMPIVDLNEVPNVSINPINLQDEKTICCWCCADGPITMDVHLDRGAFVVGEKIPLKVDVSNSSNRSLESMKIKLASTIEERVTRPNTEVKSTESVIASEVETGVGAHGTRTYNFEILIPPNTDVPNFETCRLFRYDCVLTIEGILPGLMMNMEVKQPIKLGHVLPRSIAGNQAPPYPGPPDSNQPGYGNQIAPYPGTPNAYPPNQPNYGNQMAPYPGAPYAYPPNQPNYGNQMAPYPGTPNAYPPNQPNYGNQMTPYPGTPNAYPPNQPQYGNQIPPHPNLPNPNQPPQGLYPSVGSGGWVQPTPGSNVPSNMGGPSAPTKAELAANQNTGGYNTNYPTDPPPPSYNSATSQSYS